MEKLGIDFKLLLTQVINFAIILFVLKKLLYKPILRILKDRKSKIEEGLAWTQKAKEEEEKLAKMKQEVLREARDEARVYLNNAKKDALQLKEEILKEGKAEVAQMKKRLEEETKSQSEEMAKRLTAQTVDLALSMIKQIWPEVVNTEKQHEIVAKRLKQIHKQYDKSS